MQRGGENVVLDNSVTFRNWPAAGVSVLYRKLQTPLRQQSICARKVQNR